MADPGSYHPRAGDVLSFDQETAQMVLRVDHQGDVLFLMLDQEDLGGFNPGAMFSISLNFVAWSRRYSILSRDEGG